jgi:phosphate transport system substrate-binding protein
MENLVRLWGAGFRKYQPNIRFSDNMPNSACAIGGLYTGVADLAVMGREVWPIEISAFYGVFHSEPLEIMVATGSFDLIDKTPAVSVFVHRDNPITKLSMKQLDGIFGAMRTGGWKGVVWHPEVARSAQEDIRTWGQLGLTGEWVAEPIQTYGYDLKTSGSAFTFERLVFKGGEKWNPNLREYVSATVEPVTRGGPVMIRDLVQDKYGIAYTLIQYARPFFPQVKLVAIAAQDGDPYIEPTRETCQNRTYPLVRAVYVYAYREPGRPLDPKLKEFLKYILSREGQQVVVEDQGY